MARLPRISPADIPVHVLQRGNNRQVCFTAAADYHTYLAWLQEYSQAQQVEIHAWVLMGNHLHLLCTPRQPGAVSLMMQSLGRRYVRYFNQQQQRSGALWEGRFRSCLVQEEGYLLEVYRYIELNPVRAEMVAEPGEYPWSSHAANAGGSPGGLLVPHPVYLRLGENADKRRAAYLALFEREAQEIALLQEIRDNTNQGRAIGNPHFKAEMSTLTGRRLTPGKRGRPLGWRKNL